MTRLLPATALALLLAAPVAAPSTAAASELWTELPAKKRKPIRIPSVAPLVADVTDQPGALPLMQYALTELWEQQVSGMLTLRAYRELGCEPVHHRVEARR